MKYLVPILTIVMVSLWQVALPARMFSILLVLDLSFIAIIIASLSLKSKMASIWISLLSGFIVDLWLPSHFGVWMLSSVVVSSLTIGISTKIFPRQTKMGLTLAAGSALFLGGLIIYSADLIGANLTFLGHLLDYLRFYLIKIPLDLIIFWVGLLGVRKILSALKVGQNV